MVETFAFKMQTDVNEKTWYSRSHGQIYMIFRADH